MLHSVWVSLFDSREVNSKDRRKLSGLAPSYSRRVHRDERISGTLNQGIVLVPAPGGRAYIPRGVAIYTWYMPGIYPSVWVEHIPAIYTEVCP